MQPYFLQEKRRKILGEPAWMKALNLKEMLQKGEGQRLDVGTSKARSDGELLAHLLGVKPNLKEWTADTCGRYLQVAAALNSDSIKILRTWHFQLGRECLMDNFTCIRAAVTAVNTPEQLVMLLEKLRYEQICGLRSFAEFVK